MMSHDDASDDWWLMTMPVMIDDSWWCQWWLMTHDDASDDRWFMMMPVMMMIDDSWRCQWWWWFMTMPVMMMIDDSWWCQSWWWLMTMPVMISCAFAEFYFVWLLCQIAPFSFAISLYCYRRPRTTPIGKKVGALMGGLVGTGSSPTRGKCRVPGGGTV